MQSVEMKFWSNVKDAHIWIGQTIVILEIYTYIYCKRQNKFADRSRSNIWTECQKKGTKVCSELQSTVKKTLITLVNVELE